MTPHHLSHLATFLFFAVVIGFLVIRVVPFFFTPEIHIRNPGVFATKDDEAATVENWVVYNPELTVEGMVIWASSLTINGEEVYIGQKDLFHKKLELEEGVNMIALEAESIFGRRTEIVRRVVYINSES